MDAPPPPSEVQPVAAAIQDYLARHPRAADTAQGIQRWWLAPTFGEVLLKTVEAALAQLEQQGVVRRLDASWSGATFGSAAPGGHMQPPVQPPAQTAAPTPAPSADHG